jgi:hypothetical protein
MPLLLAASDEALGDGVEELVAAARPPIELDVIATACVGESGSNVDAVAMLRMADESLGAVEVLGDSSSGSLLLAVEVCLGSGSLVAGGTSVFSGSGFGSCSSGLGACVACTGASTLVFAGGCVCVTHTTSPVNVFGNVTTMT